MKVAKGTMNVLFQSRLSVELFFRQVYSHSMLFHTPRSLQDGSLPPFSFFNHLFIELHLPSMWLVVGQLLRNDRLHNSLNQSCQVLLVPFLELLDSQFPKRIIWMSQRRGSLNLQSRGNPKNWMTIACCHHPRLKLKTRGLQKTEPPQMSKQAS